MALGVRLVGTAFVLFPCLLLGGCGAEAKAARPARVDIAAQMDRAAPAFGTVTVRGLDAAHLRRAKTGGRGAALVVLATQGSEPAPGTPPVVGKWRVVNDELEFTPAFAPSGGMRLLVRVDTAALAGRVDGAPPLEAWFEVPLDRTERLVTQLLAIHPTADTLPENQLRWYLEFSAPMQPGEVLEHVHLVNDSGATVNDAFLMVADELWDPSGTRLTLLLDPGRVKRGIRTNLELGRPLQAGRRYTLRIDPEWRDAAGQPLGSRTEKRFAVVAADFAAPNPASWTLTEPQANTRAALVVRFGESLDHALARRLLAVYSQAGDPIAGEVTLAAADREWRFTPAAPWSAGAYQVRVSPELEDLAGNRPGRVFDRDIAVVVQDTMELVRRFEVK